MAGQSLRDFLNQYKLVGAWKAITTWFSKIEWPRLQAFMNGGIYYRLKEDDHDRIRRLLKDDYFVILTRRKAHLTTYLIALVSWMSTKKVAYYTHALMNCEGDIQNNIDFKLVEATAPGTHYSTFLEVFDCDSVVLLKPKGIELALWTKVLDKLKSSLGTPYDDLFDLTEDKNMSCVELVNVALQQFTNYELLFPNLIRLIKEHGNDLTPQMMFDSGDFEVVLEVRR